ncbi:YkvA family protein [Variovorax sp. RT4R15]|uniref:YkvA family protein n=1 Tax=Variovorax sp. RT4R15 TaxID=3443737 RepID=UPI003F46BE19
MSILQEIRQWARRVKRYAVTLWFACRHPGTLWLPKALAAFVVAYALSPIDLIPDFIPVLGYVDDALLLPGLIWLAIRLLPKDVLAECRIQADDWMRRGEDKPRSPWGIAFVAAAWLGVAVGLWLWLR